MRKMNTRVLLFVVLAVVSIASHWYLNSSVSSVSSPDFLQQPATLNQSTEEEYDEESSRPVLPDVHLLKKVVETGRRLIPAQ